MRKWLVRIAILAVVVSFAGCATLGTRAASGRAEKAIALINTGDAVLLSLQSPVPFLFDGEILLRQGDVEAVWRNLSINGFRLDAGGIMSIQAVGETSYTSFGSSAELEIFFKKNIEAGTLLCELDSDGKRYRILIGKSSANNPQIRGIAGFAGGAK